MKILKQSNWCILGTELFVESCFVFTQRSDLLESVPIRGIVDVAAAFSRHRFGLKL